jgi:hypothetical protein
MILSIPSVDARVFATQKIDMEKREKVEGEGIDTGKREL